MNVVFLCGYPFEENRYGVAEHVFQITRHIRSIGQEHTCHIISMHNRTAHWEAAPRLWVHTIQRKPLYYALPFLAVRAIQDIIQKIKPDIIHLHGTTPPYVWAAGQMAGSMPVLVTIHGDLNAETRFKRPLEWLWAHILSLPLLNYALLRIKNVITCSEYARAELQQRAPRRLFVIPNGVDLEHYLQAEADAQRSQPYILYMGGLRTIKGVDLLIRAFAQIRRHFDDIELIIAGDGPEEKTLKRMTSELNLGSRVCFLGFVGGEKKLSLLQQASLMVIPSRFESFPIGLLEALACGTPLVAARVGGIQDIIHPGENGWLFEPENVDDLTEKMNEALHNPEKRAVYRQNGLKTAAGYSWENVARQTLQTYRQCIADFNEGAA